jgi:hypothetical protein
MILLNVTSYHVFGARGQVLKRFDELGAVREPVRCTDAALQRNYIHAYRGRD